MEKVKKVEKVVKDVKVATVLFVKSEDKVITVDNVEKNCEYAYFKSEENDKEKEERTVTTLLPDDDKREKIGDVNRQVEASIFPDDILGCASVRKINEIKPDFIEKFRAVANSEKMRQDASAKSGSVYKDRLAWLGPEKIWMSDLIKRKALIKQESEGNIRYQQTQIKICDKYRHSCL